MHRFYYDESEHSRRLTHRTITADNFYDGFVSVAVGWDEADEAELGLRYADFEERHKDRASGGEIKSTTIKQSQLRHGFASLNKNNLSLLEDCLATIDDKAKTYLCYQSKVEYMVGQLFRGYRNSPLLNMDHMRYSITKAVVDYRPLEIIESMYGDASSLVRHLRVFLVERIREDMKDIELKEREINAFKQALMLLDGADPLVTLDWEYSMPFVGLTKYIEELGVGAYSLVIDKENRTVEAAMRLGLKRVRGADSKDCFGLRMADMLAGVLTKLMKAIHEEVRYHSRDEFVTKRLLDQKWFRIDDRRLRLYKRLGAIVIESHKTWDKVFAGSFSDDLVMLIALLTFMADFDSSEELRGKADMCPEWFNTMACNMLEDQFRRTEHRA